MAICFVKSRYVSRSSGGNACRTGAYNARTKIIDERTGEVFDFTERGGNVYHEILLPEHVDKSFKNASYLSNKVELSERRKDSQVYVEWVLALPKEDKITLEMKKELINMFIEYKGWVKEGLGVQIDIHEPHEDELNWHAHLLVPTRRFTKGGKDFDRLKARDMQPQVCNGKVVEETKDSIAWTNMQNNYYKKQGLDIRVDEISTVPQEHVGPVRMRSVLNQAVERNEYRAIAHLENMRNGKSVLERITRTQSIFKLKDLDRAVKDIPSEDKRIKLLNQAINSKSLVPLYNQKVGINGKTEFVDSGFYTTREVREEENRIMRIADKIFSQRNYSASFKMITAIDNYLGVSDIQRTGLKHLLLEPGGIRILRGRAGTGKSHMLGALNELATGRGQNVIGLAPTHKAKMELKDKGYAQTNTVKGFLFAVKNGRAELSRHSTLVVDEAGMVGNRDLQELLKCAHSFKCNVILAGDERQLTSVERGGLFAIMAEQFKSYELSDIRRQSEKWGREMASYFASGNTDRGIDLLHKNKGIVASRDLIDSVTELVRDWSRSKFDIQNRLIVTVRNLDANLINNGIREVLKQSGTLSGREFEIESKEIIGNEIVTVKRGFMKGERVLFTASDKDIGISNGQFGTLASVSKNKFTALIEDGSAGGREVSFKPGEIGLKHGYAVTTYKSQGASLQDVYTLHNGAGNCRTTYVGLTRHIESMSLYYNTKVTSCIEQLKIQLGKLDDKSSSLTMLTHKNIELKEAQLSNSKLSKIGKWFKEIGTNIADSMHKDHGYYEFKKANVSSARVEEVLAQVSKEVVATDGHREVIVNKAGIIESKVASGGSNIAVNTSSMQQQSLTQSMTPKQKFYSKVDQVQRSSNNSANGKTGEFKGVREVRDYKRELEMLKNEMRFKVESIANTLIGYPNKSLSNGNTLRYGSNGSLAIGIRGAKTGTWFDFEEGKGGDLISLVQRETGQDFKGSVEYLQQLVGVRGNLKLVRENDLNSKYNASIKEQELERQREIKEIKKSKDLFEKGKTITEHTIAGKYLSNERAITVETGHDIKTTGLWDKSTAKRYPAIIAFARNQQGKITGGQTISLAPDTATKADIDIVKKSFGKIGGSFVEVQRLDNKTQLKTPQTDNQKDQSLGKNQKITFIAEGLETALSIKEAKVDGKILCSLGIGNIKNYQPAQDEKIIICADNDYSDSKTSKTVEVAKMVLEEKGAIVQIVMPEQKGDFNDVLKLEGTGKVKEQLLPAIKAANAEMGMVEQTRIEVEKFNKVTREDFAKIDQAKLEAKSFKELMPILTEEQKYTTKLAKDFTIDLSKLTDRKLNVDAVAIESINRDGGFLIKNKVVPEERLLITLKNAGDLGNASNDMLKECKTYAQKVAHKDISELGKQTLNLNEENKVVKVLKDKKLEHQELKLYLKETIESIHFKRMNARITVYDISEKYQAENPEQSLRFKEEMHSLNRFASSRVAEALKTYEGKGLCAATDFAKETNIKQVVFSLEHQQNILNSHKSLKGKEYIATASKDEQVMRYVDLALSQRQNFSKTDQNNNLIDYANQRDANKILESLENKKAEYESFKTNFANMNDFAGAKELREGLSLYKVKGLNYFIKFTDTACTNAVSNKIERDMTVLKENKKTQGFDGIEYRDKVDYMQAISKDERIMQYIPQGSAVSREIEKQQQEKATIEKNKSSDFER